MDEGAYLDLGTEGRVLGTGYVAGEAFQDYLKRHNGRVGIHERLKDPDALCLLVLAFGVSFQH